MTPMMEADDIAHAFNSTTERKYWKATVGGTRSLPTVYFKSRSAMVELTYYPATRRFAVTFNRATCAFGDFMGSTAKALAIVLSALKAAGHDVGAPLDDTDGTLRLEFDPKTKVAYASLARLSDDWQEYAPETVFKADVPAV